MGSMSKFLGFNGVMDLAIPSENIRSALELLDQTFDHFEVIAPLDQASAVLNNVSLDEVEEAFKEISQWIVTESNPFDSCSQVLDNVPTVSLVKCISMLMEQSAGDTNAANLSLNLLRKYDQYLFPYFESQTQALVACFQGILHTGLMQADPSLFKYYLYQALEISNTWAFLSSPHLKLSKVVSLDSMAEPNPILSLFSLWVSLMVRLKGVLSGEACYNIWLNLEEVFPLSENEDLLKTFQRVKNELKLNWSESNDSVESYVDSEGNTVESNLLFLCYKGVKYYWIDITHFTFVGRKFTLTFVDSEPLTLDFENASTFMEALHKFSAAVYSSLYIRWLECFVQQLPVEFGNMVVTSQGIEHDGVMHSWNNITIEPSSKDANTVLFVDSLHQQEFAALDMLCSDNAMMIVPLQRAVDLFQVNKGQAPFDLVWESLEKVDNMARTDILTLHKDILQSYQ